MSVGRRSKLPVRGERLKLARQWTAAPALPHVRSFRNRYTRVSMGMPAASEPGFVHLHVHSVLFAAGRGADHRPPGGARQEGPSTRIGADRHRQHVRSAGVLREDGERRHPADHRLCARRRFRRPGKARRRGRRGMAAPRAFGRARGGLPQPDAVEFARLPGNAADRAAAHQARLAGGRSGWPDCAHRRSGRAARPRDRQRPKRARAVALRSVAGSVRRSPVRRIATPRDGGGTAGRAGPDRARLCARHRACRRQRAVLRRP